MDRRERINDPQEALLAALEGFEFNLWTALPAIIRSYNPTERTCTAEPAVQCRFRDQVGNWNWIKIPILEDVPVCFPGGGGYSLTFPVRAGDECLLVFSARCLDGWWQSGGVQIPPDLRLHDLSDAVAYVGLKSKFEAEKIEPASITGTQLTDDAQENLIDITEGVITLRAVTKVIIDAPLTQVLHALEVYGPAQFFDTATVTGLFSYLNGIAGFTGTGSNVLDGTITVTDDVIAGGISLVMHTHGGVDPGGSNTAPPNP